MPDLCILFILAMKKQAIWLRREGVHARNVSWNDMLKMISDGLAPNRLSATSCLKPCSCAQFAPGCKFAPGSKFTPGSKFAPLASRSYANKPCSYVPKFDLKFNTRYEVLWSNSLCLKVLCGSDPL